MLPLCRQGSIRAIGVNLHHIIIPNGVETPFMTPLKNFERTTGQDVRGDQDTEL
jgi:hypothetical protein